MTKRILIIFLTAFSYVNSNAQIDKLKNEIDSLLKSKNATVGVSMIANNFKDTVNINGNLHLPMQSVFKFPIALAVLSEVDKGRFKLNQKIKITSNDLNLSNDLVLNWSPIKEKFPNGTTMTLAEIIQYTVVQSDNNGCDILLRLLGGTTAVEKFLFQHQISDISIKAGEGDMHKDWDIQFLNWATPIALTNLLTKFYLNDNLLSEKSYQFLWKTMKETSTGMNRIKGQLPQGTIVAHKTGTSGSIDKIVTPATNDMGIILLPNGNPIFISVLVSNSEEDNKTNEKIISDIAKKIWDYYSK
ncbi:MAG: class A beta-lactamase, subclass A2 [Paludibacter sp.]|nr:class A beta-lactamase, subclass A2 [Paludibacter sp.]